MYIAEIVLNRNVFLLLFLIGLSMFAYSSYTRIKLVLAAQPIKRFDRIGLRLKGIVAHILLQQKLFYDLIPGLAHAFIFWGFCVVSLETLNFLLGAFGIAFRLPGTNGIFYTLFESISVLVLIAVIFALSRRLFFKSRVVKSFDGILILLFIAGLMITALFMGAGETVILNETNPWKIVSHYLVPSLSSMDRQALTDFYNLNWWIHGLIFIVFLNYLPLSKHMHLLTIVFNVFFRDIEPKGRMTKLDLENSERFGLADFKDLTRKDVLDGFTCTECGRCTSVCPANLSGKHLDPKKVVADVRNYVFAHAKQKPDEEPKPFLEGAYTDKEDIFSCTTCYACVRNCPTDIEHLAKIFGVRRNLVLMEGDMPEGYQLTLRNLENNGNPWGMASSERGNWAGQLGLPTFTDRPDAEYVYFIGCAGCYDARAKETVKSFTNILNKAGVSYAVLGNDEFCCGETARRTGNEYLFQQMLEGSRAVIDQFKLQERKIITADPHCFNTLKNEFSDFGIHLDIEHHSTFLEKLLREDKLKIDKTKVGKITIHDSCYIGRYNDTYDAPRNILKLLGAQTEEMANHHLTSMCCGAGGGRMWLEEDKEHRVNLLRAGQAVATGAQTIAVACPYCATMFEDGLKALETEKPVRDLAQLVESALEE